MMLGRRKMTWYKTTLTKFILLVCAAIVFACFMSTSGATWDNFYNVGKYYESKNTRNPKEVYVKSSEWTYQTLKASTIADYSKLELYCDGIENNSIIAKYYVTDQNDSVTYTRIIKLVDGKNVITLDETARKKFLICYTLEYEEEPVTFTITSYKAIENPAKGNWRYTVGMIILGLPFIYVIAYVLRKLVYRYIVKEGAMNNMMYLYPNVIGKISYQVSRNFISEKLRSGKRIGMFRIALWLVLALYVVFGTSDAYSSAALFNMVQIWEGLIIIALSLLYGCTAKDDKQKIESINKGLVTAFLGFVIALMLSNFVKYNLISYGLFIFVVVGFFGYSIAKCDDKKVVIGESSIAARIMIWVITAFCLLFRQKQQGILYNGICLKYTQFAYFLVVVNIILMANLARTLLEERYSLKNIVLMVECSVGLFFLLLTHAVLPIVCVLVAGVWFMWPVIRRFIKKESVIGNVDGKHNLLIIITSIIVAFAVVVGIWKVITIVPTAPMPEAISTYYSEEKLSKVHSIRYLGFDASFEYERKQIFNTFQRWKLTAMQANLFGNGRKLPKLWSKNANITNAYFTVLYRYGILAFAFYVATILHTLISLKKRIREEVVTYETKFSIALVVTYVILGLYSLVESPCTNILWIAAWLIIATNVFRERKE